MHSLVINKKWLFGFLVAILAGLLLLVPFGTEAKAATTGTGKVVVIDPGHQYVSGVFGDTGALSPDFVSTSQTPDDTEAYLNVQFAYKLCHELQDRGYTVYSTSYIASDVPNLIAKSKGVSYTLRDRINASATVSPNLYISVHHNVTGVGTWTSACGAEVLYDNTDSTLKSRSCTLANLVYNSMATLGSSVTGNRYTHVKNQAATVLTYNTAPAVTVEVGFMDNVTDLAWIQNESSQQVTVEKIADGVDSYITQYPGNPNDSTPPTAGDVYTSAGDEATTSTSINLEVADVQDDSGVQSVKFLVYNYEDGHTSDKWIEGTGLGNNKWGAIMNLSDWGYESGTYIVDVFATDTMGNFGYVAGTRVKFKGDTTPPTGGPAYTSAYGNTTKNRTTILEVANVQDADSSVKSVQFRVYNLAQGHSSDKWITGTSLGNNKWGAQADVNDWGLQSGTYIVDVFATDTMGNFGYIAGTQFKYQRDTTPPTCGSVYTSAYDNTTKNSAIILEAANVKDESSVKSVQFRVYNLAQGHSSDKWITGTSLGNNKWGAQMNTSDWGYTPGTYIVEVFTTDTEGNFGYAGETSVKYARETTAPTGGPVYTNAYGSPTTSQSIILEVANVTDAGSGVKSVAFRVWPESLGDSSAKWYTGTSLGNEKWGGLMNVNNWSAVPGVYNIEAYATDNFGNTGLIATTSVEYIGYTIMGGANATRQQMINYYIANARLRTTLTYCGPVDSVTYFPTYYGITLGQFVDAYIYEAYQEGVRPEVAFAQMCHETGFLRFGGQVSIGQLNFAGIGATDGGAAGASFSDILTGIRAQIQHLKAYASTEALNNTCVDPRFSLVTRGCAPRVEDLGNGYWASSSDYGTSLLSKIYSILSASTANIYGATDMTLADISLLPTEEETVEPSEEPTESTEPSEEPTESTEPSEEPTESAEPSEEPTESTEPSEEPTESTEPSEEPTESTEPSEEPTESTEPSAEPTESMESVSEADTVPEYVIMSSSAVTTEQLKNIFAQYQSVNPMPSGTEGYDELGFPTYYGMTFEQFANQYVQEATAEGVNPAIAFAQAMVETDYLRFTGSAGIDQYNFGGFVTDGTMDSFSDLTTGIRAQIQHLKCFASTDPCVNAIVDLHWDESVRGTAATLQELLADLGKDESYSNKIWSILNQLD